MPPMKEQITNLFAFPTYNPTCEANMTETRTGHAFTNPTVWTGGSRPPTARKQAFFLMYFRRMYFREQVKDCGGLDLWACAGTSALERARIFWNRANYDAWATVRRPDE